MASTSAGSTGWPGSTRGVAPTGSRTRCTTLMPRAPRPAAARGSACRAMTASTARRSSLRFGSGMGTPRASRTMPIGPPVARAWIRGERRAVPRLTPSPGSMVELRLLSAPERHDVQLSGANLDRRDRRPARAVDRDAHGDATGAPAAADDGVPSGTSRSSLSSATPSAISSSGSDPSGPSTDAASTASWVTPERAHSLEQHPRRLRRSGRGGDRRAATDQQVDRPGGVSSSRAASWTRTAVWAADSSSGECGRPAGLARSVWMQVGDGRLVARVAGQPADACRGPGQERPGLRARLRRGCGWSPSRRPPPAR